MNELAEGTSRKTGGIFFECSMSMRIKRDEIALVDHILWRDRMGVPSKCTIARATDRSAYAPEVLSGRNKIEKNPKEKKNALCICKSS
jgi:hypothetical protein